MSTTIRLARMGKRKRPFYRLVAMDNRKQRDGKYLANLGYYNPFVLDVAAKYPEKVKELKALLEKYKRDGRSAHA